jgi:hypothetical protein
LIQVNRALPHLKERAFMITAKSERGPGLRSTEKPLADDVPPDTPLD